MSVLNCMYISTCLEYQNGQYMLRQLSIREQVKTEKES